MSSKRILYYRTEEIKHGDKPCGYAFVFEKPWNVEDLPVTVQYVKLMTANGELNITTTIDVYMPVDLNKRWAGDKDPKIPLDNSKASVAESENKYNKDAPKTDKKKFPPRYDREQFYVRDEEGQPHFITINSDDINCNEEQWDARLRNPVNSIDEEKG